MRRREVHTAPAAETDLDEAFLCLAHEAGPRVAIRFDDAVRAALLRLAEMPQIGAPQEWRSPRLAGVRMWPVPGFGRYLIFYRERQDGVEVLRVLDGARDVDQLLLGEDDGPMVN